VYTVANEVYARRVDTRSRRRRLAIDLAICAALLYAGLRITTDPGTTQGAGADTYLDTLLIPAVIFPILLRHSAPFAAAAALAAGCVVSGLPTFDQFRVPVVIPAALLIVYPLGRDTELPKALGGLALVLVAMVFVGFTDPVIDEEGGPVSMIAFSFPLYTGIWAGGRLIRSRDQVAAKLAERSRRLERQREQTAQLAVEVERTQLASDLDLAARDRVRRMIELSEEGEQALAIDPELAPVMFARIERMGRDSLNEMRGLLGVLRSDERGTRSPRPTLAQLETLLAEARGGGRLVDLKIEGDRRPLPGGVELAAYRVLQHALVAVRGGDGEAATIELHYLPTALELHVAGFPTDGSSGDAALAAARERATSQGGSFSTENSSVGKRLLRARLPTAQAHG
jgi:signal transduction histidine kinase